jgi:hypothetical protein
LKNVKSFFQYNFFFKSKNDKKLIKIKTKKIDKFTRYKKVKKKLKYSSTRSSKEKLNKLFNSFSLLKTLKNPHIYGKRIKMLKVFTKQTLQNMPFR